jgi:heme/copper-type cytochrome/quinol oxidase subunit 1
MARVVTAHGLSPQRGSEAVTITGSRRELWGWSAVAVGSLAIAGLFALLLAVSRIPGIESVFPWPLGFFHKGLVIHVVFSFVVWFLAVFGAMLHLATAQIVDGTPRLSGLGTAAVWGMAAACPLLFVPALLDRGEPTLNNYVPVIIDPLYYAGLLIMAVSMTLAVVRLLVNLRVRPLGEKPLPLAMAGAGIVYLVALVCFAAACGFLAGGAPSHAFNEELFWGGGHVLQFLNTLLLLIAWSALASRAADRPLPGRGILLVAVGLMVVSALPAPLFYVMFEPFSAEQSLAFTNLQYALAVPPLLVAGATLVKMPRPLPWRDPAFLCLVLSAAVFMVGGFLGLFVDGADTRTPAHYHGVIAGVSLAFMGLFLTVFLPSLGRPIRRGKKIYALIYLFAGGQLAACIGLFWAGGFGAPRKIAGEAQGLEAIGAIVGMTLNGVGALVAVIGGVLFIWTVGVALLQAPEIGSGRDG